MKALDLIITDRNLTLTVQEYDGEKWVPLKPICEAIGLQPHMQTQRVRQDERFMSTQLSVHDRLGRTQDTTHIPLTQLEAFLFTINTRSSMKPEVASRLLAFQKGLTQMIHKAFNGEMLTNEMYVSLMAVINDLKATIQQQQQVIDYLIQENSLNRQYVDQRLSSVGGKLLSSMAHKKRKAPVVG